MKIPYVAAGAEIDGAYRYSLWRRWSTAAAPGSVLFVMLNPSTADAYADDPTIRRCMGFARSWGYGGIMVGNLFAFRAADPRNDVVLGNLARAADLIVCAWGAHRMVTRRAPAVIELLRRIGHPHYLELTATGEPRHPLYLRADLSPVPWMVA